MVNLDTLTVLAQEATPGPWTWHEGQGRVEKNRRQYPIAETFYPNEYHNAAFIAACSPDAILALVARVRELESALTQLKFATEMCLCRTLPETMDEITARQAQLQVALVTVEQVLTSSA